MVMAASARAVVFRESMVFHSRLDMHISEHGQIKLLKYHILFSRKQSNELLRHCAAALQAVYATESSIEKSI